MYLPPEHGEPAEHRAQAVASTGGCIPGCCLCPANVPAALLSTARGWCRCWELHGQHPAPLCPWRSPAHACPNHPTPHRALPNPHGCPKTGRVTRGPLAQPPPKTYAKSRFTAVASPQPPALPAPHAAGAERAGPRRVGRGEGRGPRINFQWGKNKSRTP